MTRYLLFELHVLAGLDFDEPGSVWALLKDQNKGPNPDDLRNAVRTVLSTRRQPTVQNDHFYITIDTACENTVVGSHYMTAMWRT